MSIESRSRLRGLYAITPELRDTALLLSLVRAAIDGGATLVQYRAKDAEPGVRARQAEALLHLCRARHVPLIVNDDLELAAAIAADGVHLGADDGDPRLARERMPGAIIGVSCYDDPARAQAAARAGADYVGIGAVFASSTKPQAVFAGLSAIASASRLSGLPVAAIGGITPDNAPRAIAAGADMVAVISALFCAADVTAAARALSRPFDMELSRHV
jgi:thiamine-phosphate pyrophosphorylase